MIKGFGKRVLTTMLVSGMILSSAVSSYAFTPISEGAVTVDSDDVTWTLKTYNSRDYINKLWINLETIKNYGVLTEAETQEVTNYLEDYAFERADEILDELEKENILNRTESNEIVADMYEAQVVNIMDIIDDLESNEVISDNQSADITEYYNDEVAAVQLDAFLNELVEAGIIAENQIYKISVKMADEENYDMLGMLDTLVVSGLIDTQTKNAIYNYLIDQAKEEYVEYVTMLNDKGVIGGSAALILIEIYK